MFTATTPAAMPGPVRDFRRQWWRVALPAAFAVVLFGMFAFQVTHAVWIAVPGLCLILLLCVALHGGLIISRKGIAWYIVRPSWRYRVVPWHAVLDVRKSFLGLMPYRLVVKQAQYEPWVWGTPRPDRPMDIEIWPNGYTGGEAIWDTIHQFWSPQEHVTGTVAVK